MKSIRWLLGRHSLSRLESWLLWGIQSRIPIRAEASRFAEQVRAINHVQRVDGHREIDFYRLNWVSKPTFPKNLQLTAPTGEVRFAEVVFSDPRRNPNDANAVVWLVDGFLFSLESTASIDPSTDIASIELRWVNFLLPEYADSGECSPT